MSFAHLHVHTHYSTLDGICQIGGLFKKAQLLGMPAIALTDHDTLSGAREFLYVAARNKRITGVDIKPIIGCQFHVTDHFEHTLKDMEHRKWSSIVLLAKNLSGYHNLVRLSSIANTEGIYYKPRISHALLERYHEGLICLSGGIAGEIGKAILTDDFQKAIDAAKWSQSIFGDDFYLEAMLHTETDNCPISAFDNAKALRAVRNELKADQIKMNEGLFAISEKLGIKVVATNDVHFIEKEDGIAQDMVVCSLTNSQISNPKRLRYTHYEYMKAEDEMRLLFPDHPEVIDNTIEVVNKVEQYDIEQPLELPALSGSPSETLRQLVLSGAEKRYGHISGKIQQRIDYELSTIQRMGFDNAFLLFKDMVDWARNNSIVLGPGRGSAPGSIVNYCLGITEIDPMKYGLLFERFINPDKVAMPDVAIDVEKDGRARILEYLRRRYSCRSVAEVSALRKFKGRSAFRLAAKVFGVSRQTVSDIAKLIPERYSLDYALQVEYKLIEELRHPCFTSDERLQEALKAASLICGNKMTDTLHSSSVIIASGDIMEHLPIHKIDYREGIYATYYYDLDVDRQGVLRIDLCVQPALDIIKSACHEISVTKGEDIDIKSIPLDDPDTLAVFAEGNTEDVFQFESKTFRKWVSKFKPTHFSDIYLLDAAFQPYNNGISSLIEDKNNDANNAIKYPFPIIQNILEETYGNIVYEEQLMSIVQSVAGFTPGESVMLWKAIVKSKSEQLESLHGRYRSNMRNKAKSISDMARFEDMWGDFCSFSWNLLKSHYVGLGTLSYRIAWLKAHYPDEFAKARAKNGYD